MTRMEILKVKSKYGYSRLWHRKVTKIVVHLDNNIELTIEQEQKLKDFLETF